MLWVKIGKSVLSLNEDLYICLCYVTPDESSRQSLIETNIFDRLLESVVYVENKTQNMCNILICRDFNSRTSVNPDFVTDDNSVHMSVVPDDYISDSFLQRFSEDEGHTNSNGTYILEFCKQSGMRIMNGRIGNDYGLGRYTFVGNRGSSVVVFVLSKSDFFNFAKHFEVQEPNILSDHCLIELSFEFGFCQQQNEQSENFESVSGKHTLNNDSTHEFLERLDQPSTAQKLISLNTKVTGCSDSTDIDS